MKKIFAIALALVMVFSMASAFAANECYTWGTDWSCSTDATLCGKGSVEVVPYVKVNTSCGWEWQVSDCAAAIKTENVYYAIKLTVEENPDPAWWAEANLTIEAEGLVNPVELDAAPIAVPEAGVYYLAENLQSWFDLEDWADLTAAQQDAYIFGAQVDPAVNVCDPSEFEVCVTLASHYDGVTIDAYNVVGDYRYRLYDANEALFTEWEDNKWEDTKPTNEEFSGTLYVWDKDDYADRAWFTIVDGSMTKAEWTDDDFYNKVMADFGLAACGTAACFLEDNFLANFGWDDEQEDCFNWSDKGAAVVDTDCVVAIPKTGDASLLWWLF